jgi:hypothetical protein
MVHLASQVVELQRPTLDDHEEALHPTVPHHPWTEIRDG